MKAHRDLIRLLLDSIDQHRLDRFDEIFAREVLYERPGHPRLEGLERLKQFYENERPVASGEHRLEHLVADDACGAAWGRFVGTGRDGSAIDLVFADVYTFAEGRIAKRRSYLFR